MGQFAGATLIAAQDLYSESSVKQHKLGQLALDNYGNRFRYIKAGTVALATGHLLQESAEDTNYRSMVVQAAAAIGDAAISVTLGGTAVTAEQFNEGILLVESSTGLGQKFNIVSHTVQTSTTGTCTFTVDRPLKIALTTSSQVTVRKNPYDGAIDFPVTPTGGADGVALYAMTIAYYGWIQSGGDCGVLFDTGVNTSADVTRLIPSQDVAGSVSPDAAANVASPVIGYAREQVSVDSTFGIAHLTID